MNGAERFKYLSGAQFRVGLLEFVPDRLEDGGKGRDSDSSANQHADLIVKHVLAGCAKRPVHAHSGAEGEKKKKRNNQVTVFLGNDRGGANEKEKKVFAETTDLRQINAMSSFVYILVELPSTWEIVHFYVYFPAYC